jgi:hypothetical protein
MRYMLLLKGDPEPGSQPDERSVSAMGRYVKELTGAGVLLAAEGLLPTSAGARIRFAGGGHRVVDGPVARSTERIAGTFLIDVRSMAEAVAWASRCPLDVTLAGGEVADIEVRQAYEIAAAG